MAFDIRETAFKLPKNWKLVRLSDIAKVNEKSLTKKSQPNFIRYIDISSVSTGAFDTPKLLKKDETPSRAKRILRNNDFIISTVRPNLKQFSFIEEAQENLIASTGFCVISSNNSKLAWYLYSLITSDLFTEYLVKIADGGAYPAFNPKEIEDAIIPLPDKDNLEFISDTSRFFYKKIQLNIQINQTLEQIAQALFKSWFVDFDPVRAKVQALSDGLSLEQAELAAMQAISGKTPEELTALSQTQPDRYAELAETAKAFPCEMVEVDGVEVPKGWNLKALDKIANYQNGLALQKFRPEDDEPFLPVVKIAQLRQGYADGEEKAKASIKPECIIDNGDVIFSWSGSLLVDIWCGGKAALNQHLFKVTSKRYPKWFYYFYTKYHLAEFQRIAYDKAVTMGHIKREHLSAAKCIVPNDELLANKTLENILEKIIFNRLENFNLQNTRDLLFPRFLNGDIKNE